MNHNIRKDVCDNTFKALDLLIDNSFWAQYYAKTNTDNLSLSYLKEYCTTKLCTARQCGHTTAIAKIAVKRFNQVAFITYNQNMVKLLHRSLLNQIPKTRIEKTTSSFIKGPDINYVFHTMNTCCLNLRGNSFQAVFVDCASFMSKSQKEKLYEDVGPCLRNHDYKYFVFVE